MLKQISYGFASWKSPRVPSFPGWFFLSEKFLMPSLNVQSVIGLVIGFDSSEKTLPHYFSNSLQSCAFRCPFSFLYARLRKYISLSFTSQVTWNWCSIFLQPYTEPFQFLDILLEQAGARPGIIFQQQLHHE